MSHHYLVLLQQEVNNIPDIDKIGAVNMADSELFIITKSTATVLITDLNNTNANVTFTCWSVNQISTNGNADYTIYNVGSLEGNVSVRC